MFMKQIAVVGSVLVLGGYLAASDDALAGGLRGLGQRPSQPVKNGTPKSFSGSTIRNGNNSKPVLGYKW
jgi:hypothetical protein